MSALSVFAKGMLAASVRTRKGRLVAAAMAAMVATTGAIVVSGESTGPQPGEETSPRHVDDAAQRLLDLAARPPAVNRQAQGPITQEEVEEAAIALASYRVAAEATHEAFTLAKRAALDNPGDARPRSAAAELHAALKVDVLNLNRALGAFESVLSKAEATVGKPALVQHRALLASSAAPIEVRATEILRNATLREQAKARSQRLAQEQIVITPGANSQPPSPTLPRAVMRV